MGGILKILIPVLSIVLLGLLVFTTLKACQDKAQPSVTSSLDNSGLTAEDEEAEKEAADLFAGEEEEPEDMTNEEGEEDSNTEEAITADEEEETGSAATDTGGANGGGGIAAGSSPSDGDFLVLAGTFISQPNAEREVSRLKKMGYNNAEIVEFDFSEYHTVCVDRKSTEREANTIKRALINQHEIEAYVHKKRPRKRNR
ncbi:MAG: hypothetical protein AAGG75_21710 [Bacteroidota bacterium]